MYINLDETYIIKSDENNYILCELRVASDSAKNAGETLRKLLATMEQYKQL